MKKTLYIFALLAGTAISTSVGMNLSAKEKETSTGKTETQQVASTEKSKPAEKAVYKESGWLNEKNLPQYFGSPCPFYITPKQGC